MCIRIDYSITDCIGGVGARKHQFRGRGGAAIGRRETPIGRPAGYGLEAGDTQMIFGIINKRLVSAFAPYTINIKH